MLKKEELLNNISSSIKKENMAFMLGAGISLNSGMPIVYTEKGLVSSISRSLLLKKKDLQKLLKYNLPFEAFIEQLQKLSSIYHLLKIFQGGTPSLVHLFIGKLYQNNLVHNVLTTNFDTLVEKTFGISQVKRIHVLKTQEDFDLVPTENTSHRLVKIHGCVSNMSDMAITLNQVANSRLSTSRRKQLEKVFSVGNGHDSVMILGYSASDIFDLIPIIQDQSNKEIKIYYIRHVADSGYSISPISSISHIETGKKLEYSDEKPIKNPFLDYAGYWISMNTNMLIEQLWRDLFTSNPVTSTYKVDWKKCITDWSDSLSSSKKNEVCSALMNLVCEYDSSIYYARKIAQEDDSKKFISRERIAVMYHRQGKHAEAIKEYEKLLSLHGESKAFHGRIYDNLAKLFNEVGRYDEATSYAIKALAIFKDIDNQFYIISAKRTLANSYIRSAKYEKGFKLAKESMQLAQDIGEVKSAAYSRVSVARALGGLGN